MKFHVRNQYGELVVGSYAELRQLYERDFISDDDEIRRDDALRWTKAGAMPDLRQAKPHKLVRGNEFAWLALAICVGTLLLMALFAR